MPAVDLILRNANVITLDPSRPLAHLVAINGDRIVFVGRDSDLETVAGPGTKVIDCESKTLIPGFNDSHCHIFSFIRKQLTLDLSFPAVRSIEDIKAIIRRKAQTTPPGQWINGSNYSDFHLAEKRNPTRWDLDEAARNNPVIISHRSLHACVLNTRALELADIRTDTPEPPGASIHRDTTTGEPDGVLFDMLGYIRYNVMPPMSEAELDQGIDLANRAFISQGITSLQDATVTNEIKRWKIYRRYKDRGLFKSRVYMMTGADNIAGFREAGLAFRAGDDSLRMGGLKIVLGETTGQLFPSQPDLNRCVLDFHRAGCQVALHAVEPTTVEAAVAALEYAIRESPGQAHRHRIEHCAECPPALFERVKKLGVIVSTQPPFLYYGGERYLALIPTEGIRWLYRAKAFFDAGTVVAAGSDTPVAPNNPIMGVYAAVVRRTAEGQAMAPEERVSAEQALAMYTTNAAYASFDEQAKGSITAGKLADLVLLSDDPTRVEPEAIKDIKVLKTIIGGEVVWEA